MASAKATPEQVQAIVKAIEDADLAALQRHLKSGVSPNLHSGMRSLVGEAANKLSWHRIVPKAMPTFADREAIFLELVKAGANVHVQDLGFSVLEMVSQSGSLPAVQAVISRGIKPIDELDKALIHGCESGEPTVVKLLIEKGADVNFKNFYGDTPLISAIVGKSPQCVALLLESGASTDVKAPRKPTIQGGGKKALQFALHHKQTEIAEILKGAGAKTPAKSKVKRPTTVGTVTDSWNRIAACIKQQAPKAKLDKGVTDAQLKRAEKELGFALSAELRELYRTHNGDNCTPTFPNLDDASYYMHSLEALVREWKTMNDLLKGGDFDGIKLKSQKGIRKESWNVNWIPFAGNGGGDLFCVDLAPADGGTIGQIITWGHESNARKLLAPSLRDLLHKLANDLEDDKFTISADGGIS